MSNITVTLNGAERDALKQIQRVGELDNYTRPLLKQIVRKVERAEGEDATA